MLSALAFLFAFSRWKDVAAAHDQILLPSDSTNLQRFGHAIATTSRAVYIGTDSNDGSAAAVYVFEPQFGITSVTFPQNSSAQYDITVMRWRQTARLQGPTSLFSSFGSAVAAAESETSVVVNKVASTEVNEVLVVGASGAGDALQGQCFLYSFTKIAQDADLTAANMLFTANLSSAALPKPIPMPPLWGPPQPQQSRQPIVLQPLDPRPYQQFGAAVAMSGTRIVAVGAPRDHDGDVAFDTGAVYLFRGDAAGNT